MFVDIGFANDIQQAVFQFQKLVIGLPVLVFAAAVARFLLCAAITLVAGRALGGLLANAVLAACAVALLSNPSTAWSAVNYSSAVASRLIGAGGLPGLGVDRAVQDALHQITGTLLP